MSIGPCGPHQISRLRRVCVPKLLAARTGLAPGRWVRVAPAEGVSELVLRAGRPDRAARGLRDVDRARKVGPTGQVTLPAALMDLVALEVHQWVYFALGEAQAVRVIPATAVSVAAGAVPGEGSS